MLSDAPRTETPDAGGAPDRSRAGLTLGRGAALALAVVALVAVAMLSISVGSRSIPLDRVWSLVLDNDGSRDALIVHDLRVPRTILGLLVGAALGMAGALMQALTRNPLADPGLLGVNAGAALAVVVALALFEGAGLGTYVWFAFAGAGLAAVLVYRIGAQGHSGATPVRLALAGTAVTATLISAVEAVTLYDTRAFDDYRRWVLGSLAGRDEAVAGLIAPFIVGGLVIGLLLPRALNAIALGDDQGRALGANVELTRLVGFVAVTLLCGAATAAAGPIVFIGLAVPHMVRALTGPDQRWVLPLTLVVAPVLLLAADVIGRVIDPPGEIAVGVVCAFLGGPVFIALVRGRRVPQL